MKNYFILPSTMMAHRACFFFIILVASPTIHRNFRHVGRVGASCTWRFVLHHKISLILNLTQ